MQFMSKTFCSLQRTHIWTYFILRVRIYCSKFTHKNTTETEYQRQRHETRKTFFNYDGHMEKAGKLAWLHPRPSFGVFSFAFSFSTSISHNTSYNVSWIFPKQRFLTSQRKMFEWDNARQSNRPWWGNYLLSSETFTYEFYKFETI